MGDITQNSVLLKSANPILAETTEEERQQLERLALELAGLRERNAELLFGDDDDDDTDNTAELKQVKDDIARIQAEIAAIKSIDGNQSQHAKSPAVTPIYVSQQQNDGMPEQNKQEETPKEKQQDLQSQSELKDPAQIYLKKVRDLIQARKAELETERRLSRKGIFSRLRISGKNAKIAGLEALETELASGGKNVVSSFTTKLSILDIHNCIVATRANHPALNKSRFGARTTDLLDYLEAEARLAMPAEYAVQEIVKRENELAEQLSTKSFLFKKTQLKHAKKDGLSQLRTDLGNNTLGDSGKGLSDVVTEVSTVRSTTPLLFKGFFSKTAKLLNKLEHIEQDFKAAEVKYKKSSKKA